MHRSYALGVGVGVGFWEGGGAKGCTWHSITIFIRFSADVSDIFVLYNTRSFIKGAFSLFM